MAGNSPTFGNHWGPGRNPRAVLCCLLDSQEGVSSLSPRSAGEIPSSEAAQRRKELPHLLPAAGWSRRTAAKYVFFLDVWQSTPTLSCLQNSRSLLLASSQAPSPFLLACISHREPRTPGSVLSLCWDGFPELCLRCLSAVLIPVPCVVLWAVVQKRQDMRVFKSSQEL